MDFCPSCGAMMKPANGRFACTCGHTQDAVRSQFTETPARAQATTGAVDHTTHPLAAFDHVCSKCGFGKARLVGKGIFVSDEDESIEYICGKCGHHDPEDGLKVT